MTKAMNDKCVICGKVFGVEGGYEPCFPADGGEWIDGEWSAGYECASCHEAESEKAK